MHAIRATMKKALLPLVALGLPLAAAAHEGHGLPGVAHWHASDVLLVLAAVVGVGSWLARRR